MFKMKKVFVLILCVLMCVMLAFTGCGKKTKKADSDEPVKLVWYTIGTPQSDTPMVQEEINKYLLEKINAELEIKQVDWGDYNKKLQVAINTGEKFDICFTCSWANDYLLNARKGAFVPMNELLEEYGKETLDIVNPAFWDGAKLDGKIYAIPANKELGVAPTWVFTKEYVDKYNFDIDSIKKMEDIEPMLKKIKENESDVVPFYLTKDYSAIIHYDKLLDPLAVSLLNDDLKVVNIFETDEMIETLKLLHKWYELGYINKDAALTNGDKTIKRLLSKADGQPYAENIWSKDLGYRVVSTPILTPYISNQSTTGSMQAISVTSENPEKAMEFLNLLNSDPYLRNLVNYGIEDVHYEKVSDTAIKMKTQSEQYRMPYFSLGNLFNTYTLENEPATKWDEFESFNAKSVKSPALGFKFDPEAVSTEVSAFRNILDEFGPSLYSGSVDPEEYLPKLNKKLKDAGIEKVIDEMQKQIDEWKKIK